MSKANLGIIGMGVMGQSLALNAASKDISMSVYNRWTEAEKDVIPNFLSKASGLAVQGHTELAAFVSSLESPRKILLMIPQGKAVDTVIEQLLPLLQKEDIIMDGGNSHYRDTQSRFTFLKSKQIHFLGIGVSGGESGALSGPSLMIGGSKEAYDHVKPILESLAAKDKQGRACAALVGPDGSGHFVKTIHNGIEYAEMQLLAECYALLLPSYSNTQIAELFEEWQQTALGSYLLEITIDILNFKEDGEHLLDKIVDKASSKGTGSWSSQAASDLGVPASMIHAAVTARSISMLKDHRTSWATRVSSEGKGQPIDLKELRKAYSFARIINHHQGLEVIIAASNSNSWDINLSEVARIWTEGCIIKSNFMEQVVLVLQSHASILESSTFFSEVKTNLSSIKTCMNYALKHNISTPCISNSLQYFLGMTTTQSSANLIQAQRDYFGAHTYQRTDKPKHQSFTTNWNPNG